MSYFPSRTEATTETQDMDKSAESGYVEAYGYVPHPRWIIELPPPISLSDGSIKADVTKAVSDSIKKNPVWSQRVQMSSNSCIFRVPKIQQRHNERAYKPTTFSIGPVHRSNSDLKRNNGHKFQYLNDLVSRVDVQVERLVAVVAALEPMARTHYAYDIKLSPTEFVEMLVLDGCFIIEYLRKFENAGITLRNNGVLEVSPLRIEDTSEALFRNIIAFEQCVPGCTSAFTSYVILLDNLINTTGDLDRLQQKGIVSFMLNPDDALGFFNKLYNDTALNEFYYPTVCGDINAYCRRRRWPRWRASLVRNYFSSPWVIVSTLAAFVLLVLTFLQTLYTMT